MKKNGQYQRDVMERFMDSEEFNKFHAQYKEACSRGRMSHPASKKEIALFKEYKKGALIGELMQKHGTSRARVMSAINRVAREIALV